MSWSFQVIGKADAVSKAAAKAMESKYCQEPEESYRQECLGYIMSVCGQMAGPYALKVEANGSMSKNGDEVTSHSMSLNIVPIYGFVE